MALSKLTKKVLQINAGPFLLSSFYYSSSSSASTGSTGFCLITGACFIANFSTSLNSASIFFLISNNDAGAVICSCNLAFSSLAGKIPSPKYAHCFSAESVETSVLVDSASLAASLAGCPSLVLRTDRLPEMTWP